MGGSKKNKNIKETETIKELKKSKDVIFNEFSKMKDSVVKKLKNQKENMPDEIKKGTEKIVKEFNKTKDNLTNKIKEKNFTQKEETQETNNKKSTSKKQNESIQKETKDVKNIDNKYFDIDKILENLKEKFNSFMNYIKKVDKKIFIAIVVVLLLIIFLVPNLFKDNIKYDYDYIEEIVLKYKVKIKVDFEENLLFSKYDVELSIGSDTKTLKHGKDVNVEFYLEEGEHTLTFTSADDSSISKDITINVTSNMEVGVKISCHYDKVSVTKKYTDKDEEILNDEIKMTTDKSAYIYKNYKDVIKDLEKIGFTNIEENPMYDIELGWTEQGEVDSVKINGKDNYKKGDVFAKDVKVVVSYHMNINDDPTKITPPYTGATSKKYDVVVQAFKDAGFTNVIAEEGSNYFDETENTVSGITVDGESIRSDRKYKPNAKIVITYYGNSKDYDSKEEDELSLYYAKKAFEKYGEKKYPYGFKCHWIVNNIAQEQSENGKSWYFKVGVTIENAYGNKREAIAEGTVSGNDYSQTVTGFYVN